MQASADKRSCFWQQQQQQAPQPQARAAFATAKAPVAEMLQSLRAMGGSCAEELLAFLELQSALLQVGAGVWRFERRGKAGSAGVQPTLESIQHLLKPPQKAEVWGAQHQRRHPHAPFPFCADPTRFGCCRCCPP